MNGGSLPKSPDQAWLGPLIAHSQARKFLSRTGYKFVSFQNGYPFLNILDSDVYLAPTNTAKYESGLKNFELIWLKQTPVNYLVKSSDNKNSLLFNRNSAIQKFGGLYDQTRITLDTLPKSPTTISEQNLFMVPSFSRMPLVFFNLMVLP